MFAPVIDMGARGVATRRMRYLVIAVLGGTVSAGECSAHEIVLRPRSRYQMSLSCEARSTCATSLQVYFRTSSVFCCLGNRACGYCNDVIMRFGNPAFAMLRLRGHIFIAHFLLRRKLASVKGHFLTHFPRGDVWVEKLICQLFHSGNASV